MSEDPKSLLDELTSLRRKARDDRHGYWLPFLLFGLIAAGAIPLHLPEPHGEASYGGQPALWHWLHPIGQGSRYWVLDPPELSKDIYWLVTLTIGFLVTVWWYRWRAQRVGVETSTRLYTQVTVFLLALPLLGVPVLTQLFFNLLGWPVALPMLVIGVTAATLLSRRKLRTAVVILTLLLVAHLAMIFPYGHLLVIAVGLLGLAWVERSALCTTFAVLFAAWVLLMNSFHIWVSATSSIAWPVGLIDFADLLVTSVILVLGGLVGLVGTRRKVSP